MTIIFNGKAFAKKREAKLAKKISKLTSKPALAIIIVGNDKASHIYVNLKQKAASRVGIKTKLFKYNANVSHTQIIKKISELNSDKNISGILVQLPLPINLKVHQKQILQSIKPEKDVDGLRVNSPFLPATVKAVLSVLKEARVTKKQNILVLGSKGEVGHRLLKKLKQEDYSVKGMDMGEDVKKNTALADVIISATGKPNLVKANMVKQGVIALDVGSPKGDFDKSVYKKASFLTPVPGGIGPVTVISLLENVVQVR